MPRDRGAAGAPRAAWLWWFRLQGQANRMARLMAPSLGNPAPRGSPRWATDGE
ncbi:MAG: hypothetical protein J0H14_15135 [Alphaproteobacteria bacterium]|nr:hypothetical protein [Alphaproteobacteria bacterium]